MTGGIHKYWGFISYSHRDRQWGEWLHKAIESYRVPARLAGTRGRHGVVPQKLFPIFRDRTELSAAGGLDVALQNALDQSRCLIIICSPASAASRWVNEEILYFKRRGGEDRILCLIVDGEPGASAGNQPERECFPPALRFKLGPDGALSDTPAEPLAADLREQADGRDGARLKILAGLLGVGFDDLKRRDLQTRNRRLAVLAGISTAVSAAMVVLAVKAFVAQKAAERSRQQGEDLISFMLGDLREKLEPLGKLEILDAVGDKAMGYFGKLDNNNLSEAALTARAKALRQIGDVRMQQGRAAEAAEPLTAALTLNKQLVDRHPNDPDLVFELGQSEFYVGYAAWRSSRLNDAELHWGDYLKESERLVVIDPNNPKWQLEISYSLSNLGTLAYGQNRVITALGYFNAAIETAKKITPQSKEVKLGLALALSWKGSMLQYRGDIEEALVALSQQAELYKNLSSEHPEDATIKGFLAGSLSALAYGTLESGDIARTESTLEIAKKIVSWLTSNDPTNRDYKILSANLDVVLAGNQANQNLWGDALKTLTIAESKISTPDGGTESDSDIALLQNRIWQTRGLISLEKNNLPEARHASDVILKINHCDDVNPSAVQQISDQLIGCANAYLLSAEAGLNTSPINTTIALQKASALIDGIPKEADKTSVLITRARRDYLSGKHEKSLMAMTQLIKKGYRSFPLYSFIRRHCNGNSPTTNENGCDALLTLTQRGKPA